MAMSIICSQYDGIIFALPYNIPALGSLSE